MSGTDLPNDIEVRKGAIDAIRGFVRSRGGNIPPEFDAKLTSGFPNSAAHH